MGAFRLIGAFQQKCDEQGDSRIGGRVLLFGVVDNGRDVEALRGGVLQQPVGVEADRKTLSAIVAAPLRQKMAVGGEGSDERMDAFMLALKAHLMAGGNLFSR